MRRRDFVETSTTGVIGGAYALACSPTVERSLDAQRLARLDAGRYDSTWWNRRPIRLIQTNLREIDAGMDDQSERRVRMGGVDQSRGPDWSHARRRRSDLRRRHWADPELRLRSEDGSERFHPILEGLEDAFRIINGNYRLEVTPNLTGFPRPVTLIPSYPDLPMEHVYPREPETDIREVYLREVGQGRVAYIPWDIDRTFWQILNVDHGRLLRNIVRWALGEQPVVAVEGPGLIDVTAWRQERSMTVHLVNLTNPMMLKGPFRELLPVDAQQLSIEIPRGVDVTGVQLLVSQQRPRYEIRQGRLSVSVPRIVDHEIVAVDLGN